MVTITNCGITMQVPASELYLYTRAGFVVVEDPKPEPVKEPELAAKDKPKGKK